MKSLHTIGSHVITSMSPSNVVSPASETVRALPLPTESAMTAFLAQRQALRAAGRTPR